MNSTSLKNRGTLDSTNEVYFQKQLRASCIIYVSLTIVVIVAVVSLPFIHTQISIKSPGFIRPASEVSQLRSSATARIKEVFVNENSEVGAGQLLFVLEMPQQEEREKYLTAKQAETKHFISDLNFLLQGKETGMPSSSLYQQSLFNYTHRVFDLQTHLLKVEKDYERSKKLYNEKVIPAAEYEKVAFDYDKAKIDLELLRQSQLNQWQQELHDYEKELSDFQTQLTQLQREKDNLFIKAPVGGTIQNLAGLYPGSFISTNQELALIIPQTGLLAEVYVSPNDIGLLQPGMAARFQIAAFNYNQWGMATGHIKEISSDVHIMNNQPVFKVKCVFDKDYLELKNGYKGKLKKGMSLQTRFLVTERSLWQLLYDKMDDWVNPNLTASPN